MFHPNTQVYTNYGWITISEIDQSIKYLTFDLNDYKVRKFLSGTVSAKKYKDTMLVFGYDNVVSGYVTKDQHIIYSNDNKLYHEEIVKGIRYDLVCEERNLTFEPTTFILDDKYNDMVYTIRLKSKVILVRYNFCEPYWVWTGK